MTLRITSRSNEDGLVVLGLEGRFTAVDLPVFEACLAGRAAAEIALDLSELRWLDSAAIERLDRLLGAGARLLAISPFVDRLLARAPGDSRSDSVSATHPVDPRAP